jgi:hypothetical protein
MESAPRKAKSFWLTRVATLAGLPSFSSALINAKASLSRAIPPAEEHSTTPWSSFRPKHVAKSILNENGGSQRKCWNMMGMICRPTMRCSEPGHRATDAINASHGRVAELGSSFAMSILVALQWIASGLLALFGAFVIVANYRLRSVAYFVAVAAIHSFVRCSRLRPREVPLSDFIRAIVRVVTARSRPPFVC